MPSFTTVLSLADVPRLLTEWRHHLDEADRHESEARKIETTLRTLLPPGDPALRAMKGEGRK